MWVMRRKVTAAGQPGNRKDAGAPEGRPSCGRNPDNSALGSTRSLSSSTSLLLLSWLGTVPVPFGSVKPGPGAGAADGEKSIAVMPATGAPFRHGRGGVDVGGRPRRVASERVITRR